MTDRHECLRPGCHASIPADRVACLEHWRELPWSLRARIYREYHKRPGSGPHLRALGDAVYCWSTIDHESARAAQT